MSSGHDWKDPATDAAFALNILCDITLTVLLVISLSTHYTYNARADQLSKLALIVAIFTSIIAILIILVTTGIVESHASVSQYVYVAYILSDALGRIAEIATAAFISRLVLAKLHQVQSSSGLRNAVKYISILALALITALEITCFGIYTAFYASIVNGNVYALYGAVYAADKVGFALAIVYLLLVTFLLIVLASKGRSISDRKVVQILSILLFVALWIYHLVAVVSAGFQAVDLSYDRPAASVYDAYSIIAPIMTAILLTCAVLLGTRRFRDDSDTKVHQYTSPNDAHSYGQVPAYTGHGLQGYDGNAPTDPSPAYDPHRQMAESQQPPAELHGQHHTAELHAHPAHPRAYELA